MGEGGRDIPKNWIVASTVSILAIALLFAHSFIDLFFQIVYMCVHSWGTTRKGDFFLRCLPVYLRPQDFKYMDEWQAVLKECLRHSGLSLGWRQI